MFNLKFRFNVLRSLGFALGAVNLIPRQHKGFWQFQFNSAGPARQAVGALRSAGFTASFFFIAGLPFVQVHVPSTIGFAR